MLIDSADYFLTHQKWEMASHYITKALRLQPANPTNGMLFSNLGICQANTGDYAASLQSFEIALIKSADSVKTLYNRARTHLMMDNQTEALIDLNSVLAIDSLMPEALQLRGAMLQKLGKTKSACHDFERLLTILPSDPLAMAATAECKATLGNFEEADSLYIKALDSGNTLDIYQSAIPYYLQTDQFQKADDAIYQALKNYPREGILYLYRAILHRSRFETTAFENDLKLAKEYGVDTQTIENIFPTSAKK